MHFIQFTLLTPFNCIWGLFFDRSLESFLSQSNCDKSIICAWKYSLQTNIQNQRNLTMFTLYIQSLRLQHWNINIKTNANKLIRGYFLKISQKGWGRAQRGNMQTMQNKWKNILKLHNHWLCNFKIVLLITHQEPGHELDSTFCLMPTLSMLKILMMNLSSLVLHSLCSSLISLCVQ